MVETEDGLRAAILDEVVESEPVQVYVAKKSSADLDAVLQQGEP